MERYIGLDVHSITCTAVVIGPSGKRLGEAVIETAPKPLIDFLRSQRKPRVLVMEEGNQSDWMYEVLSPHVEETLVVQPSRSAGKKNDRCDAERLARQARLNEPGTLIYKSPNLLTALRQSARSYVTARQDTTRHRAQLKLLMQARGLHATSAELLDPDNRAPWIEQLPVPMQLRATLLGTALDGAVEVQQKALEWMLSESRNIKAVRWIKSVPGIGNIRAPLIASAIISPQRFRTKRQLWSYAGLGVVLRSSSDWELKGGQFSRRRGHELAVGLNRNRNPVLKEAFVGAAQQIISRMHAHPLNKSYRERLERGMSPSNARLTLARKIAAIVLAVWKRQEVYDPTKS
jgi:transposase